MLGEGVMGALFLGKLGDMRGVCLLVTCSRPFEAMLEQPQEWNLTVGV